MQKNLKGLPLFIYFLLLSIFFMRFCWQKPILNWDILPYVAVAKSYEIKDTKKLMQDVLKDFKDFFSRKKYYSFVAGNKYRKKFSSDVNCFEQQLTFYKPRVVYTFLIFILDKFGFNIIKATYLISILSVVLSFWIIYFSFKDYIAPILWFIFPLFLLSADISILARLSTPDAVAFLGLSIFLYLFVQRKDKIFLLFLPFLIFIRNDLVLFSVIFLLFYHYFFGFSIYGFVSIIFSISIYLFLVKYFSYYNWKVIIYHTFFRRVLYPAHENITINMSWYLVKLKSLFLKFFYLFPHDASLFIFYMSMSLAIVLYFLPVNSQFRNLKKLHFIFRLFFLNLISIVYCILHVLLFPAFWSRFFSFFYIVVIISIFVILTQFLELSQSGAMKEQKGQNKNPLRQW